MLLLRTHRLSAWLIVVPCLLGLAAAMPSPANGQANSASLSGTLTDSSGGVLPGVTVICKNIRTGQTLETVTNEVGIFRFAELPIGQYEVTATLQGFQKLVAGGINLITGQSPDLKLTLQPGGLETTVEVSGATPVVQTSSSTVQTSMTVRQVQELPLNGRNPLQLVALTAGASITAPGAAVGGAAGQSGHHGQRAALDPEQLQDGRVELQQPVLRVRAGAAEPGHARGVHGPVGELQRAHGGRRRAGGTVDPFWRATSSIPPRSSSCATPR